MEALTMCRFQHANGSYSHVGQQAPRLSTNTNCGNPNRHVRVSSIQKHFTWLLELEGNFSGSLDNVSFLILSLLTGRRWRRGGRQQQHPLRAMCIWRVHFIKPRYSLPRCDLQGSLKLSQTCCLFASKVYFWLTKRTWTLTCVNGVATSHVFAKPLAPTPVQSGTNTTL